MTNSAIVTPFRPKNTRVNPARAINSREPRERSSEVDARIIAVCDQTIRAVRDGSLGRLQAETPVELKKLLCTRIADRVVERKRRGKESRHRRWLARRAMNYALEQDYLAFDKIVRDGRPTWHLVVTQDGQARFIENCKSNHPSTRSIKRINKRKVS